MKLVVIINIFTLLLVVPVVFKLNQNLLKEDIVSSTFILILNFITAIFILDLIKNIKEMLDNK